jgi:hypothetical protein
VNIWYACIYWNVYQTSFEVRLDNFLTHKETFNRGEIEEMISNASMWYIRAANAPAISSAILFTLTDWLLIYKHSILLCTAFATSSIGSKAKNGTLFEMITTSEGW